MTESHPPYNASSDNPEYDDNGLDAWGHTRQEKDRMLAMLAQRFEEEPDTMATLLNEYRRQESIGEEALANRLMISRAQLTHLRLCLVPDSGDNFASDLRQLVEVTGADMSILANICRQVFVIRNFPKRTLNAASSALSTQGRPVNAAPWAAAAREREPGVYSLRESRLEYEKSEPAHAASAPPEPTTDAESPTAAQDQIPEKTDDTSPNPDN